MKGARLSLMGIRKALAGPDFVKEENTDDAKAGSQTHLSVKEENTDDPKLGSQTHLLVATLIATVTFTAAFTVPGGYQSQGVDEGLAVLGKRASFRAFMIANTLAFGLSITSILVHFLASLWNEVASLRKALETTYLYLYLAIIALVVAFISGTYTVVPHLLGITAAVILSLFFYISMVNDKVLKVIFCLILYVGKVLCPARVAVPPELQIVSCRGVSFTYRTAPHRTSLRQNRS